MRLLVVRGFTRYMVGIDPRTEIPPTGLIRFRQHRRPPFIYGDAEILALMAQARDGIRQELCAATYETLIGLLAATGMRISEAIKLDNADIDWGQGVRGRRAHAGDRGRSRTLCWAAVSRLRTSVHRVATDEHRSTARPPGRCRRRSPLGRERYRRSRLRTGR